MATLRNFEDKPKPVSFKPKTIIQYFETREDARRYCNEVGLTQSHIQKRPGAPKGRGWCVE